MRAFQVCPVLYLHQAHQQDMGGWNFGGYWHVVVTKCGATTVTGLCLDVFHTRRKCRNCREIASIPVFSTCVYLYMSLDVSLTTAQLYVVHTYVRTCPCTYVSLTCVHLYIQWKLIKTNYKGSTKSVFVIRCSSYQDLLDIRMYVH